MMWSLSSTGILKLDKNASVPDRAFV